MSCGNSGINPDNVLSIEKEYPQAEEGTMLHKAIENYIVDGDRDISNFFPRLEEIGAKSSRFIDLFHNMVEIYESVRGIFTDPITEHKIQCSTNLFSLSGHIDLHTDRDNIGYAVDWKTGRVQSDHYHQMAAYAWLLKESYGYDEVYISAVYAEEKEFHKYSFSSQQLNEWAMSVEGKIQQEQYTVGSKCATCPLHNGCPAYREYTKYAMETLLPTIEGAPIHDVEIGVRSRVINNFRQLKYTLEDMRRILKDQVKEKGPLALDNNMQYTIAKNGNLTYGKQKGE